MAISTETRRGPSSFKMWARGRLDISWGDLLFALRALLFPGRRPHRVWPTPQPHLALFSVRTAWNALLCAQKWPKGSEIIVSEANIPSMIRLIELHGLVPVSVPLDVYSLEVKVEDVEDPISERTRAILISPLFGSRMNMQAIGAVAQRHNLLLVEGNAQAFSDTEFRGSPEADVAMFSFGLIKTRTALGGAVVFARDPDLLKAMKKQAQPYPLVSTREFLAKWAWAVAFQCLSQPFLFGLFWRLLKWRGIDPDIWISSKTRGLKGEDLLVAVRRRPHSATLKLLRRRLQEKVAASAELRRKRGQKSLRALSGSLGQAADFPYFWALTVAVNDRSALIERARREGFDVSFRASSVVCHGESETAFSRELERAVFLPIGNSMPETEWERLIRLVQEFCEG